MAGEDQYINPIIQAMIASSQLQGQAESRKNQVAQQKIQDQQRARELDLAQQRIEQEHQQYTDMLNKVHLPMLQSQLEAARIGTLKNVGDLAASGGDLSKLFPQGTPDNSQGPEVTPTPSINIPGAGNNIPISAFPTQAQNDAHQAHLMEASAHAQTQGHLEAMAPYTAAANQFTEKLKQEEADQAMQRTLAQGANQERIAQIRETGDNARNAATIGMQNHRTELEFGMGGSSNMADMADNAEEGVVNGEEQLSAFPKTLQKGIFTAAQAKGDVLPTDYKGYKGVLDAAKSAQNLLNQARDIANQYSSDSSGYTGLGSGLANVVKSKIPTTDVNSKVDLLKSQINSVKGSLGISRSSNPETEMLMEGIFNPARTKQQNLDNIDAVAKQLNTAVESQFPKNIPTQQKARVLRNYGLTDIGGYKDAAPATPPPGTTGYIRNKKTGAVLPDTPQNRQLIGLDPNAQIPMAGQ
jgi:hypothetical protein